MTQMCPNCSKDNADQAQWCAYCRTQLIRLLGSRTLLQARYEIVSVLGCGGMGAVYLALDHRLNRQPVAVKENFDSAFTTQFFREATVLAGLDHPNLPKVSDHFMGPSSRQYLVMEYVDGQTLDELVQQRGALPEAQVLNWADTLLDALSYLHGRPQPIFHRDIKPGNIKISSSGKLKLVDFGLVKIYDPAHPQTTTVVRSMGTPEYAPPEQASGSGLTDARSDIYSLGATLYHVLTGQAPASVTMRMADPLSLRGPRRINASISTSVEAAILKALELKMTDRFQSAAEMWQALRGNFVQPVRAARSPLIYIGLVAVAVIIMSGLILNSITHPPPTASSTLVAPTFTPTPGPTVSATAETPKPTSTLKPTIVAPGLTPEPTVVVLSPTPEPVIDAWKQGRLVLVLKDNDKRVLYTQDLSHNTGPQQLYVPNDGSLAGPVWSPDGMRLAFYMAASNSLQVLDAAPNTLHACSAPSWSPDSSQLICVEDGRTTFTIVEAGSGRVTRTIDTGVSVYLPDWSPLGSEIAYAVFDSNRNTSLWRASLNNFSPMLLAGDAPENYAAAWSHDGQWIAYQSAAAPGQSEVWIMDRNGQSKQQITHTPSGWSRGPSWSPDGQWLVFVSSQADSIGADFGEAFVVSLTTGEVYQVTHTGGRVYDWRTAWAK